MTSAAKRVRSDNIPTSPTSPTSPNSPNSSNALVIEPTDYQTGDLELFGICFKFLFLFIFLISVDFNNIISNRISDLPKLFTVFLPPTAAKLTGLKSTYVSKYVRDF